MAKLREEPAVRVRSMREFFALARAMEADAVARYTETARQLRQQGSAALADVFERLAEVERGHVEQVQGWASKREEVAAESALPWPIPDTFDAEPGEMARSKLTTPYRALASAVRHEQRSFAFWAYVSAHADDPDVKGAAERMALEELEHVSLLRSERRKAFHEERRMESEEGLGQVTTEGLAGLERRLADLLDNDPGEAAAAGVDGIDLATFARDAASRLETFAARELAAPLVMPSLPADRQSDIGAVAEYLAEAYLLLAERARSPDVLDAAQDLAKAAIYRLGVLNAAPSEEPRSS